MNFRESPLLEKLTVALQTEISPVVQDDTKKWELLKNLTKIEEIQEKKFIDRN